MDIDTWFSLSYTNGLVLDPAYTRHLPAERLTAIAAMVVELDRAFAHVERAAEYVVIPGEVLEVSSLRDDQMLAAGISNNAEFVHDGCEHEEEPTDDDAEDFVERHNAWYDETQACEGEELLWYDWRGDEFHDGEEVVVPFETVEQARGMGRRFVHRSFLQSMPEEWQERFVDLIRALDEHTNDSPEGYEVHAYNATGQRITDPVPRYQRGRTYIEPKLEALA
jgi:hypothetical protein